MAERAATMSGYDEMVAAGRSKSLTTGNIQCGVAAVHEVLGTPALETPVNCHSELMEDPHTCVEDTHITHIATTSRAIFDEMIILLAPSVI